MRAWLMDSYEGVERLRLGEAVDPQPGPAQVLLRVRFAVLNPADAFLAQALYPARPPTRSKTPASSSFAPLLLQVWERAAECRLRIVRRLGLNREPAREAPLLQRAEARTVIER